MPALMVGGIQVPVALGSVSRKPVLVGDQDRADDGSPVSDVSDITDDLLVRTALMSAADANALRLILRGAMPVSCYGDLLGLSAAQAVSCDVQLGDEIPTRAAGGTHWSITFTLRLP